MSAIKLLDQKTINQIAAGEVIDRPSSVVKELLENAIDAKSSSITVEIKEGGLSFIRITDNGVGIQKGDIPVAFLRHSTSKISNSLDLLTISSLGFRGEALSSIAAISQVELISKVSNDLTGTRYIIEGGEEKLIEEIGAPNGTTFIIRNLFFNTPARRKFLKSAATESAYINNIVEKISLSHPNISIRFINNGVNKLYTSGSCELSNIIYHIFGKDIAKNLIEINNEENQVTITGYIGKPFISRGNRNYENFFINGRYIKSSLISKAIEDAYKPYLMQNKYPFIALHITLSQSLIDVNVHPSKMEIRFKNADELYNNIFNVIGEALKEKEYIPEIIINKKFVEPNKEKIDIYRVEPFETKRLEVLKEEIIPVIQVSDETKQLEMFTDNFLSYDAVIKHKLVGQLFSTYWLIEYEDKLFIVDQHAAHEKVLYERLLKTLDNRDYNTQMLSPPIIISLSMHEQQLFHKYYNLFRNIGYEVEHFGGDEYAIRSVPNNLFALNVKELFLSILDHLTDEIVEASQEFIHQKVALLSCKAAVKGNSKLSEREVNDLISELLTLDNPYNCPHGRPTIISMSKYEIEKKFKRII